jgi:hypothetical protein
MLLVRAIPLSTEGRIAIEGDITKARRQRTRTEHGASVFQVTGWSTSARCKADITTMFRAIGRFSELRRRSSPGIARLPTERRVEARVPHVASYCVHLGGLLELRSPKPTDQRDPAAPQKDKSGGPDPSRVDVGGERWSDDRAGWQGWWLGRAKTLGISVRPTVDTPPSFGRLSGSARAGQGEEASEFIRPPCFKPLTKPPKACILGGYRRKLRPIAQLLFDK